MTAGFCPRCGKWFKSLEIHAGMHRDEDIEYETIRRIQEQQKEMRDSLKRRKQS